MLKVLIFLSSLLSLFGLYMGITESILEPFALMDRPYSDFNVGKMFQIWLGLSSPLIVLLLYKLIFKKK